MKDDKMRILWTLLLGTIFCLAGGNASLVDSSYAAGLGLQLIFDKPISLTTIPLNEYDGHTLSDRHAQNYFSLNCYYYPKFMVKEIFTTDRGPSKGAITPSDEHTPAPCVETSSDERVIEPGYFMGAVNTFLFFTGAQDSSMGREEGLTVLSSKGELLFEDEFGGFKRFDESQMGLYSFHPSIKILPKDEGRSVELVYVRSATAHCSLYGRDQKKCWETLKHSTGLKGPLPSCIKDPVVLKSPIDSRAPTVVRYFVKTDIDISGKKGAVVPISPQPEISCAPML
jgi:hypothetical protein